MNKSGELFKKIAEQRSQFEANSERNSESSESVHSRRLANAIGSETTSTTATSTAIFRSPSQVSPCPRCQWQCEIDIPCPLCGGTSVSEKNSKQ